jgi:hypothetical protein
MDRRLLSLLTAIRNRRRAIILFLLAVIIIELPLLGVGGKHSGWFFWFGIALFFYTFLHPWEFKSKYYYGTLMGISIILPLLAIYVVDITGSMIKITHYIASVLNITGLPQDEDTVWAFSLICIAAFFAGLIGLILPSND